MGRRETRANLVTALALFHRYGWIAVMTCCAIAWREYSVRIMGIFCVLFAGWFFAGYKLRWKHIYCSDQNAHRQKMTPNDIRWHTMKISDAYGVPLVFLILGLACLIAAAC